MNKLGFLFSSVKLAGPVSDMGADVVRLASLSERLAGEKRKRVAHISGRPENVAEHSLMLVKIAVAIAQKYYPRLDAGKVAIYASMHDDVEAYVGDTPTGEWCATDYDAKELREQEGLKQLEADFGETLPQYVYNMKQYEAQEEPEARFVRMVDKVLPTAIQITDGGQEARKNFTNDSYLSNEKHRYSKHIEQYPDWKNILDLQVELAEYVQRHLFERDASDKLDI